MLAKCKTSTSKKHRKYISTYKINIDHTSDLLKMLLKKKVTIERPRYTMQNQ